MPTLDTPELSLYYEHLAALSVHGEERPPLLLLAGMASDSASWQPVIAPLRQHQTLLIPDNRGSGRTRFPTPLEARLETRLATGNDKPEEAHSSPYSKSSARALVCNRDLMTADILQLLDALEIERVNVLGHSMGAMLGWSLACEAPDRVCQLISASALPQVQPARIALFDSLLALRSTDNERDWFKLLYQFLFRADFFDDEQQLDAALNASMNYPWKQSREDFAAQVAGLSSFRQAPALQNLRCPITLITGSDDVLMTPHKLMQFSREHHVHTCHVIDQAAHALHWEQPAEFVELVERSLRAS